MIVLNLDSCASRTCVVLKRAKEVALEKEWERAKEVAAAVAAVEKERAKEAALEKEWA